jgi:hypothetical protein
VRFIAGCKLQAGGQIVSIWRKALLSVVAAGLAGSTFAECLLCVFTFCRASELAVRLPSFGVISAEAWQGSDQDARPSSRFVYSPLCWQGCVGALRVTVEDSGKCMLINFLWFELNFSTLSCFVVVFALNSDARCWLLRPFVRPALAVCLCSLAFVLDMASFCSEFAGLAQSCLLGLLQSFTCLALFGFVWICLDLCGFGWVCLDVFEILVTC